MAGQYTIESKDLSNYFIASGKTRYGKAFKRYGLGDIDVWPKEWTNLTKRNKKED